MNQRNITWMIGLVATLLVIILPIMYMLPSTAQATQNPWDAIPEFRPLTDHQPLMPGPYETGQDVTRACLECHAESAAQVMGTSHWKWESEPVDVPWRDEPVTIGKLNQINNFCISAQGNEKRCATCHIGYGWENRVENLKDSANIDCLSCHANMGLYAKGEYGNPNPGIDLALAAQSVGTPTRENCGACHFNGGGGNGVKHGDLDESLYFPSQSLDVHMGKYDMLCIDCHTTKDHTIKGRLLADNYQIKPEEQVSCTDCHAASSHSDDRLNSHAVTIACQTCHVPSMALKDPTKTFWDWSTSGQDIPEDHLTYLKIKGTFEYQNNTQPSYLWYNGNAAYRYILEDKIDPEQITLMNPPAGDINDPNAKIYPFKIHVAIQPYDVGYGHLLAPITAGDDGYWTNFDWDEAFEMAEEIMGLPYSGQYGFVETWMYWPTTHMVQSKDKALQCANCHGENTRMNWGALGYPGDPINWGGRDIVAPGSGASK